MKNRPLFETESTNAFYTWLRRNGWAAATAEDAQPNMFTFRVADATEALGVYKNIKRSLVATPEEVYADLGLVIARDVQFVMKVECVPYTYSGRLVAAWVHMQYLGGEFILHPREKVFQNPKFLGESSA